jgi:hypothetical protein
MMAEKKAGRREGVWAVGGLSVSRRMRDSKRESGLVFLGCVLCRGESKWIEGEGLTLDGGGCGILAGGGGGGPGRRNV